jgi:small subunit ribosomal protein S10
MPIITAIKLTGEDHTAVDRVAGVVKEISDRTGVKMRGPIPLPTRRLNVPCRKSPDGEGSETFDHWEMRIHRRLIELVTNSSKDENAIREIIKIPIPDSVTIEINLRQVN